MSRTSNPHGRFGTHKLLHSLAEREGGWICHYCGKDVIDAGCGGPEIWARTSVLKPGLTPRRATVDHVIPQSRGGTHDFDNLVLACWSCNASKGPRDAPAA